MDKNDHEIEMLTPTTRSGRASSRGIVQDPTQQGPAGPLTIEPRTAQSQSSMDMKRRWLPIAAVGVLALVVIFGFGGGSNDLSPDSDGSATSEDEVGIVEPVELDLPLTEDVSVGPDSVQLVSPIGEFVGVRGPVVSRYGQIGPSEYSVILESSTSDLRLIDLGSGVVSVLFDQYGLALGTDRFVISHGPFEAGQSTWLSELRPGAATGASDQAGALNRSEALRLEGSGLASFAAESSAEFWTVENRLNDQLLQLRRLPEGQVVQAFETPILKWRFAGGIPIGSTDGAIYQLAPGSHTGVRRVADAELVDADSGRALLRTCDISQDRCDYQWLDRANWAPLDLPIPPPDPATVEISPWRIGGGGRWLINTPNSRLGVIDETDHTNSQPVQLIGLGDGRTISLVVAPAGSLSEFRTSALTSDGNWLATSTDTELLIVNLITGEQFRSDIPANVHVAGIIRTSPDLAHGPTGTGGDVMSLAGFERDGLPPLEAAGHSILATGWLGTGATLDLATGESQRLDGIAEVKIVTDLVAAGLGPSNDLVSLSFEDGSRSNRFLGTAENLAILPGPNQNQMWLGSSGPGIMNLTSGLALLETSNLAVIEQQDFRILTWHLGGTEPLGTSLGTIWRYGEGTDKLERVRSGILVAASGDIALVWECPNDSLANDEPALDESHPKDTDGCAFVWRSSNDWVELDLALPPNPSGVAGIYGGNRWLLTFDSPNESHLLDLATGQSVSFGSNWPDLLDVSPDGRWAIHRLQQSNLILSDLDSAAYASNGQADHADLMTYEANQDRKIASVRFLPVTE